MSKTKFSHLHKRNMTAPIVRRPLDILGICPVYNEEKFLPLKLKWCQVNGVPLYVMDNMSNDGTAEWIQANLEQLAGSHTCDTGGAFDLRILQKSLMGVINKRKPDWVIYFGCDLFYVTENKLAELIDYADKKGYTAISLIVVNLYNTGEVMEKFDPLNTYYFSGTAYHRAALIVKYSDKFNMNGDLIDIPNKKVYEAQGAAFNFGFSKSKTEREETYARRQKAWENGLPHGMGKHYRIPASHGWLWNKDELQDVRVGEFAKYYEILKGQVAP